MPPGARMRVLIAFTIVYLGDADPYQAQVDALLGQGVKAFEAKNLQQAVDAFQQVPRSVRRVRPIIPVLYRLCHASRGCVQLTHIARDGQTRAVALFNIGLVLEAANQWDNARNFYAKALEETPGRCAPSPTQREFLAFLDLAVRRAGAPGMSRAAPRY